MKVEVAGAVIEEPVEAVAVYIRRNERLVRNYDLGERDGGPHEITARDVLQTRYSKVRITADELQYFVDNARGAPWRAVPPDAALADADPEEEGGLYDAAEELYRHFYGRRPRGLSVGKIHRVLHHKRPALYPLLDGRLLELFKEQASEASRRSDARRGRRGRLYWAAIREDLLANLDALSELRQALAERAEPDSLGARLTDVRLHDILCWELVASRR